MVVQAWHPMMKYSQGLEADQKTILQVAAPSTSRSTPALRADTLLLRPGSVRFFPYASGVSNFDHCLARKITAAKRQLLGNYCDVKLTGNHRQLEREGQAEKDHRYRPHAIPQHRYPQVQERLPDRHPQGLARHQQRHGINGFFLLGHCFEGRDGNGVVF